MLSLKNETAESDGPERTGRGADRSLLPEDRADLGPGGDSLGQKLVAVTDILALLAAIAAVGGQAAQMRDQGMLS